MASSSLAKVSVRPGLALALIVCLSGGCVSTKGVMQPEAAPQKSGPCLVGVRWQNQISQAPDPANGGRMMPGLVGRVLLFGQKMDVPMEGEGSLQVELADGSVNPPKPLEQWNFPPDVLPKYLRKGDVGVGYNLFLPWSTYRPELQKVILRVAYVPKKGGVPLFAEPSTIVLSNGPVSSLVSRGCE